MNDKAKIDALRAALEEAVKCLETLNTLSHFVPMFPALDNAREVLAMAADASEQAPGCRDDGRCQYAIDHGAEGLGACPVGKCCMPAATPAPVAAPERVLIAEYPANSVFIGGSSLYGTPEQAKQAKARAREREQFDEWFMREFKGRRLYSAYEGIAWSAWRARGQQASIPASPPTVDSAADAVGEVLGPDTWPGGQWHFKPLIGWEAIGHGTKLYARPSSDALDVSMADTATVNYPLLLAKYIEHVGAEEGNTFIGRLWEQAESSFVGTSDRVSFTAEEMAALHDCKERYINAPAMHPTTGKGG